MNELCTCMTIFFFLSFTSVHFTFFPSFVCIFVCVSMLFQFDFLYFKSIHIHVLYIHLYIVHLSICCLIFFFYFYFKIEADFYKYIHVPTLYILIIYNTSIIYKVHSTIIPVHCYLVLHNLL